MSERVRVLVTGASGLIGGRLVARMLAHGGYQIRAGSRRAREWPGSVEGVVVDYADPTTLQAAVRGVDAVVNLAAAAEREANADPVAALHANTGGTLSLASAAAAAEVRRFVQLSTFKVYGNAPSGRVTEDTPTCPQSHYAITHRASEDYARFLHPHAIVLRLANGFGAPASIDVDCWSIIVNAMCRQAVLQKRIEVYGSGSGWRNFVPMDDVTGAIEAATRSIPAGTYQLAGRRAMRIVDMANEVARVAGTTLGFVPEVTIASAVGESEPEPLDYTGDRLASVGVLPSADYDEEIARTLIAAQAACGA